MHKQIPTLNIPNNSHSKTIGKLGEALAEQALITFGFEIVARNWRGSGGEVDLIARDGQYLVFVEVKARKSVKFGSPEESISHKKLARIMNTALEFLLESSQQDSVWRVDIVAIELSQSNRVSRLSHYRAVGFE